MWACNNHIKEALELLETPHVRKAPYGIKCSLCANLAVANLYYTHSPLQLKQKTYYLSELLQA
jgi:hypothetical protein